MKEAFAMGKKKCVAQAHTSVSLYRRILFCALTSLDRKLFLLTGMKLRPKGISAWPSSSILHNWAKCAGVDGEIAFSPLFQPEAFFSFPGESRNKPTLKSQISSLRR